MQQSLNASANVSHHSRRTSVPRSAATSHYTAIGYTLRESNIILAYAKALGAHYSQRTPQLACVTDTKRYIQVQDFAQARSKTDSYTTRRSLHSPLVSCPTFAQAARNSTTELRALLCVYTTAYARPHLRSKQSFLNEKNNSKFMFSSMPNFATIHMHITYMKENILCKFSFYEQGALK